MVLYGYVYMFFAIMGKDSLRQLLSRIIDLCLQQRIYTGPVRINLKRAPLTGLWTHRMNFKLDSST